jgi:hypothetical protein
VGVHKKETVFFPGVCCQIVTKGIAPANAFPFSFWHFEVGAENM